ncbi:hypothetical protein QR98_0013580 [Sarcoptes scabiei]|nr:hypothetical protein QR98_0013580 [Sarcoptes scabiei]
MAGLYFANAQEAQHFNETVQGKLENRRKKPQSKKTNHAPINIQPNDQGITIQMPSKNHLLKNVSKLSTNGSNKTKRKMLSKKDIGTPTNFQHVQHIGWNSETQSFEADKIIDKKLLSYLESQFGFTQEQLNDAGTVNFIHKFLNEHGGMDKAVKELDAPIPVPPAPPIISKIINNGYPNHTTNNQSNGVLFPPPPPVPPSMHTTSYVSPSHQSRKQIMAPSIPAAHPPPPPPLPQSLPLATSTVNVPKSIVETAPPPPPPPPPPPSFSNFSSTISSNNESVSKNNVPSQTSNNRSAFLEEIRKGAILHHVEPSEMCSNQSNNNQNQTGDVRGQLLDQIRKGVDLRKVEINANKPQTKPSSKIGGSGLADALARALQERSRALNQTDDSSNDDSNSSDDDEWDDRSS